MPTNLHAIASSLPQNLHREPSNTRGFKFSEDTASPYLNAEEGARYLRLFIQDAHGHDTAEPNVQAFYKFIKRHRITRLGCGRRILVHRRELDAAVHPVKASRPIRVAR